MFLVSNSECDTSAVKCRTQSGNNFSLRKGNLQFGPEVLSPYRLSLNTTGEMSFQIQIGNYLLPFSLPVVN